MKKLSTLFVAGLAAAILGASFPASAETLRQETSWAVEDGSEVGMSYTTDFSSGLSNSLISFPALKKGIRFSGTDTDSPVFGFRPSFVCR